MKYEDAMSRAASNPPLLAAMQAMLAKEKPREEIARRVVRLANAGDQAGADAAKAELAAWEKADRKRHNLLKAEIKDAQLNPNGPSLLVSVH